MQIELEMHRHVLLVRIEGELDHHTADQLRTAIETELNRDIATVVLLSLAGLTFMDSSGLGVILGRYRRLSQRGGTLAACCLTSQVQRIFELSGLTRILTIYATEAQALREL